MRRKTITFLCQIKTILYNNQNRFSSNFLYQNVLRRQKYKYPLNLIATTCVYSSDKRKHFINLEKKSDALKDVFEHRKKQIKGTEQKLRQKGVDLVRDIKHQKEITGHKIKLKKEIIIKDILETKAKVREKFEEVVERENVFTVPNVLCISRIILSPYLGYIILQSNYNLALGLLVYAGVTDLLDGWIARTWEGQSSKIGSFLDPMADKILIATLFVTLTWQNLIPLPLTLLIVARDVALVVAGFVIRYISLPPPVSIYIQQPGMIPEYDSRLLELYTAEYDSWLASQDGLSSTTYIQTGQVGSTLASPVFEFVNHPALQILCGLTAVTTVVSALSYLTSKNTYKLLKKKK